MVRLEVELQRGRGQAVVDGDAELVLDGCLSFVLDHDVTGDHCVDCRDLQAICDDWGTPGSDIDGDGQADVDDLTQILSAWGFGCSADELQSECPGGC